MFICEDCLTKHYKNGRGISQSWGPCEICGESKVYSDIHHSQLKKKKHTLLHYEDGMVD